MTERTGRPGRLAALLLLLAWLPGLHAAGRTCGQSGVWVQVLGSGGPEISDRRASSSYLVWVDGHARLMLDAGGGSAYNFERSGADFSDLRALLFSHFHVDHSADLAVLLKGAFFTDRETDLPLYGPSGNGLMPDTEGFVQALFGARGGAFRYLSSYLDPERPDEFRLLPHVIDAGSRAVQAGYQGPDIRTRAVAVHHGPIPALAWRVEVAGKILVFSGDMNGDYGTLPGLAHDADLLVAHNAVPEGATGVARNLHMPPSVIGRIAARAGVRRLVLSHRMRRTLGREDETRRLIRRNGYRGPLAFADDLDCFAP